MTNNQIMQAMALDLKRAAMGYYSGSVRMADIFLSEVMKRISNLENGLLNEPQKKIIKRIEFLPQEVDKMRRAEYSLTYSTLLLQFSR